MKKISIRDFQRDARRILAQVQRGQRMLLTHRGKPVARLEPIAGEAIDADDPFYSLCELAAPGESLSSSQIERILYSEQ